MRAKIGLHDRQNEPNTPPDAEPRGPEGEALDTLFAPEKPRREMSPRIQYALSSDLIQRGLQPGEGD